MTVRQSDLLGPRSSRRSRPKLGWCILLVVLLLLVGGAILYAVTRVQTAVQESFEPVSSDVLPEARPSPVQLGQRINILVLGLDDDALRSDTILLLSVDPEESKVGVLQIPRDTRALLAGKGIYGKINGAYAYGAYDKQFPGNLRALKTVEGLLDIQIHYTVVVELEGFRKIIDELGGVEVDIPFMMDYDDPEQDLHIHFQPGRLKLDGAQALEFVRWRQNNDGTGYPDADLGRIRAQQMFVRTLLDQVLKPSNLAGLPNLAVTLSQHVRSTIEPARLTSLARVAMGVKKEAIEFATLPGTDAYIWDPNTNKRLSFFVIDPEESRRLVDRLVRGIDPKVAATVRVEVAQPAGDSRAARVVDRLAAQGFAVVSSAPHGEPPPEKSRVIALRGDEAKAQLVGRSLVSQGYLVEVVSLPVAGATADVRVILGGEMAQP